jgi:beta-glucanase (GH16 family)
MPADGSWPPELDVFEVLGQDTNTVYMTNHFSEQSKRPDDIQGKFTGPDFSLEFHTFGLDWQPDHFTWYVDGVEQFSTTKDVPQVPMFLLVNLAVGGDWPGPPDQDTPFPSVFSVNYVRVYSTTCQAPPNSSPQK